MQIIESVNEMQQLSLKARGEGRSIALVPTMGYLHEGHASLLREGRSRCDLLITSIFVNPTQFGAGEDFEKYPRDMERDMTIAAAAGVDIIFAPKGEEMYPEGYQSWVNVDKLTLPLCGASRPGHFRGVTTVVCKLFNIIQPSVALFGRKDYQQLAVIRRMTSDLNMAVEIIGMPIVREADGLAMSSRNAYLSAEERQKALCLSRALHGVRSAFRGGELSALALRRLATEIIEKETSPVIDYIELRDETTLEEVATTDGKTLLALAVRVGRTRLIDNCLLGDEC